MGSAFIPYAFSVHSFINSVGADVGFASIVGLAILALLYFAQARETSTLREQAAEAQQRVQQLEARLAHLARAVSSVATGAPAASQPAQPAPAAMPIRTPGGRPLSPAIAGRAPGLAVTGAPPPPGGGAVTALPAAPAMVAAPPLTAATRLITIREPEPAEPVAAPREPAIAPARGVSVAAVSDRSLAAVGGPAPATAAGNGARTSLPEFAPDDTFYAGLPTDPPPPRAQTRQRPTQPPRRPGGPAARGPSGAGRRARRTIIALVGALLAAAIAVVAVIVISSGNNKTGPTTTAGAQAKTKRGSKALAFNPASVRVSVLNGTSSSGLAATIGKRLSTDGYRLVSTGNASDQTHTVSTVFYDPGAKNQALQVAKSLKLRSDMVEPVDSGTQSLAISACSQTTSPCTVKVVVTVGTDLETTP